MTSKSRPLNSGVGLPVRFTPDGYGFRGSIAVSWPWLDSLMICSGEVAVGGWWSKNHRPSRSMRIGTGSYLDGSRWLMTEAADARDTSCSRDRPPYTRPIRS